MPDYNKLKPRRTYDANRVPLLTDLEEDECAIGWADGKIFVRHNNAIITHTFGGSGGGGGSASIVSAATVAGFPATGNVANLYIATDTRRIYSWDASGVYVELGPVGSGGGGTDLSPFFVPPAPTNFVATAGNGQVFLTWTAPTVLAQMPIADYVVQYKLASASEWSTFADGTSATASATVTGLTNGLAYVFRVAAVNGVGVGAYTAASANVTPAAGDLYFSQVSLLMHFNGANGSTTLTDSSSNNFSVTRNGNPQISTAESKFGGSSLLLNGTSDSIVLPAASAFNFGTDNFTVELWVRFASLSGGQRIAGGDLQVGGTYNWAIYKANGSSSLTFLMGDGGSPWNMGSTNFGTVTANQWYHVAIVRNGNTFTGYLDGVAGGSFSSSGSLVTNSSNGAFFGYATNDYFNGYLDEIRITKGANGARYTANFTPPTAAFPDS